MSFISHGHTWRSQSVPLYPISTATQKSSINIIYTQSILINNFDCGELLDTDWADLRYQEGGRWRGWPGWWWWWCWHDVDMTHDMIILVRLNFSQADTDSWLLWRVHHQKATGSRGQELISTGFVRMRLFFYRAWRLRGSNLNWVCGIILKIQTRFL